MSAASQLRAGLGATLRQFLREPINLVLLVVLPPVIITTYGAMLSSFPELPYMEAPPARLGAIAGTLFVAAFLPGVIGLFQVISARRADERLTIAGFPRSALFASRLLAVVVASTLTAAMAVAVLTFRTDVAWLLGAYVVLVLAGVLYGLLGMLIGAALPRELEGSLLLIFVVDLDEAMASGVVRTDSSLPDFFPLHYPHEVFQATVEGARIPPGDLLAVLLYIGVLLGLAMTVYTTITGEAGLLE